MRNEFELWLVEAEVKRTTYASEAAGFEIGGSIFSSGQAICFPLRKTSSETAQKSRLHPAAPFRGRRWRPLWARVRPRAPCRYRTCQKVPQDIRWFPGMRSILLMRPPYLRLLARAIGLRSCRPSVFKTNFPSGCAHGDGFRSASPILHLCTGCVNS